MTQYKLSELARILGNETKDERTIRYLLTDSRTLTPHPDEALFFGLVTHKGDGHLYLSELYNRGVRAFVISDDRIRDEDYPDATLLRVPDTLVALQVIAHTHRSAFPNPVIGITGSAGKTTLKELLSELLSLGTNLRISRSPQSYNSALGVPLSLWQIAPDADLALIEAGISEPGEMDLLEEIIAPDLGIFTGIGPAHSEHFSSLKAKAKEKLRLFRHSNKLYLSIDDPEVLGALSEMRGELINLELHTWSRVDHSATLFVEEISERPSGTHIRYRYKGQPQMREMTLPFQGKGLTDDLILALLFLEDFAPQFFDRNTAELQSLLARLRTPSMRMEVIEGDNDTLVVLPWGSNTTPDTEAATNALSFIRKRSLGHLLTTRKPTAVILIDEDAPTPQQTAKEEKREERYRTLSSLISAQRGTDPLSAHKVIAIGKGIEPYTSILGEAGEVYAFPTVSDFIAWDEENSGATVALAGHLILLLPPFIDPSDTHQDTSSIPALHLLVLEAFRKKSHQTILRVNLTALRDNFNLLRDLLPDRKKTKTCAMIKAFGYGVGSYEIAKELEDEGVDYLSVAVADEGKELLERGIHTPILTMNPEPSSFFRLIRYRLEPNIYSFRLLRAFGAMVSALGIHDYPIHLSFDTGMHRLGFEEGDITSLIDFLTDGSEGARPLRVVSIFTHLSKADMPSEDAYTRDQLEMITRIRDKMRALLPYPFMTHVLNTAGLMRFPDYAYDMVRMGVGLYGLSPLSPLETSLSQLPLRPVATLESVILQVRNLKAGDTVGYGNSGRLTRDSRIGVIPIGYADGLPRAVGRGRISFQTEGGVLVPTVGNICMDATMLDLTDAPLAKEGSIVTLFGETPETDISRLAKAEEAGSGTIHYEVLARLSGRITRQYYHE